MKQHYNKRQLGDHLARFQKILWRSTTLSEEEKKLVQEEIHVYDSLMDDSPAVQRNKIQSRQDAVVDVVEARFPSLKDLVQQRIAPIKDIEVLRHIVKQVATAPDENYLRWLLDSYAA